MIELQALRPLHGDYGTVRRGQKFLCAEAVALDLESRGLARRVVVETRMIGGAPENKAAQSAAGSRLQALIAERRRSSQAVRVVAMALGIFCGYATAHARGGGEVFAGAGVRLSGGGDRVPAGFYCGHK
jgi:hypothetical protein